VEKSISEICTLCGAWHAADLSCQAIFDSFLGLEFSDPGYGEVHFLTVACFMIQHGRYSDEALIWIEQKLRAYLEEGCSTEQIREQVGRDKRQRTHGWKIIRQPGAEPLPKIVWSMTIADVAPHAQEAGSYCKWVKKWAQVTLFEMKPLISRV